MFLPLLPFLLRIFVSRASSFDVVDANELQIEFCWTNRGLLRPYFTNEILPRTEYRSIASASLQREVRYDDGLPVIHPTASQDSAREHVSQSPSEIQHSEKSPGGNERSCTRYLRAKERMKRTQITKKEQELWEQMDVAFTKTQCIANDAVEKARISAAQNLKQCNREESFGREVIDRDWKIENRDLGKQMKQQRRFIFGLEANRDKSDGAITERASEPKCTVRLLCPPDLKTLSLLLPYMHDPKVTEWDYRITECFSGSQNLRNTLQRFYHTLKLKRWRTNDALQFMTQMSELYASETIMETELTGIRRQTAKQMDDEYEGRQSARLALRYFDSIHDDGRGVFDEVKFVVLLRNERELVAVTIDYFMRLFRVAVFRKVDEMRLFLHHDAPIWKGQVPNEVLEEQLERIERCYVALLEDVEVTADLQRQYQGMKAKPVDMEKLKDQVDDMAHSECDDTMKQVDVDFDPFDELRYAITDMSIIKLIRHWIESRKESGGIIAVAVDEINRRMLEKLLIHFDDITLQKSKISALRMASRGGRAPSDTRWSYESVPTMGFSPEIETKSDVTFKRAKPGSKRSPGKKDKKKK